MSFDNVCMFCGNHPCECSPVVAAPAKKTRAKKALAPKPVINTAAAVDEDMEAIRILHAAGMLHPTEVAKWQGSALMEASTMDGKVSLLTHPILPSSLSLPEVISDSPSTPRMSTETLHLYQQPEDQSAGNFRSLLTSRSAQLSSGHRVSIVRSLYLGSRKEE